jgi:menaquinol-cytochrome c reductase iron-sulfur subunit
MPQPEPAKPLPPAGSGKPAALQPTDNDRRSFAVKLAAGIIGALVAVVPLIAGAVTFFDPLVRRRGGGGKWVRVATLDALPKVGEVYRFGVITEREDKWNLYPPAPIGAVFLRRVSEKEKPEAFTSVCPHLGCSVDFKDGIYKCPCHNSSWTIDGQRINPESCPSPRDLDRLEEVELRNENEIWVNYKRYRAGKTEKIEE